MAGPVSLFFAPKSCWSKIGDSTTNLGKNQFVIDKVRRITQINLETGLVDFTGTSVESPQIEFTGESTDKTDAQGVLLARFDTAKGVNFSGELSLLSLRLMAAQLGSEVQVASETTKVKGRGLRRSQRR